jgi:hypothetical protein
MRFSAFVGALMALAATAGGWAAPRLASHPTIRAIEAALARDGPRTTVRRLFDQGRWDDVSNHIARADPGWVALAGKLAPGTDAGTAEDLAISLAFALPRDAPAVLTVLAAGAADVADVCGAPFIEGTVRDVPAYVRRATAAVARVTDGGLAATRAACLDALAKAR